MAGIAMRNHLIALDFKVMNISFSFFFFVLEKR